MKNKLFILLIIGLLNSCLDKKAEDPLLLPPDFNVLPDIDPKNQNPQPSPDNKQDQDIEQLKDLLLKGQ